MSFISGFFSRLKKTLPGGSKPKAAVAIDPAKVKRRSRNNPYDRTSNPLKGRSSAAHIERHLDGNSPVLKAFIESQCQVSATGYDYFPRFFDLCEINGVPKPWLDQYRDQVLKHGVNSGRAQMLFRNRLARTAREKGKLLDLGGNEIKIDLSGELPDGRPADFPLEQAGPGGGS